MIIQSTNAFCTVQYKIDVLDLENIIMAWCGYGHIMRCWFVLTEGVYDDIEIVFHIGMMNDES